MGTPDGYEYCAPEEADAYRLWWHDRRRGRRFYSPLVHVDVGRAEDVARKAGANVEYFCRSDTDD